MKIGLSDGEEKAATERGVEKLTPFVLEANSIWFEPAVEIAIDSRYVEPSAVKVTPDPSIPVMPDPVGERLAWPMVAP